MSNVNFQAEASRLRKMLVQVTMMRARFWNSDLDTQLSGQWERSLVKLAETLQSCSEQMDADARRAA